MGVKKWNQFKNFIQVEVNVKCMQTDFGGCDLSSFRDIATFMLPSKQPKFLFRPWGSKIESAQKIQASRGRREMYANRFWWVLPLRFWRYCYVHVAFKTAKVSLPTMDYNSPWGQKIELAQKIHASRGWREMHANPLVLEILLLFKFGQISLLNHGLWSMWVKK